MLVQALQYPNTACERGTAGRHTKSIAPGLWFCVVSQRGWSFLPPTASWKQDSLTQVDCRPELYMPLQRSVIYFFDIHGWKQWPINTVTVNAAAFRTTSHPPNLAKSGRQALNTSSSFFFKLCPRVVKWEYHRAGESQNQVSVIDKTCLNNFWGIWEREKMEVFSNQMWFTSFSWNIRKIQLTV